MVRLLDFDLFLWCEWHEFDFETNFFESELKTIKFINRKNKKEYNCMGATAEALHAQVFSNFNAIEKFLK